jgi:hypothetical protein
MGHNFSYRRKDRLDEHQSLAINQQLIIELACPHESIQPGH